MDLFPGKRKDLHAVWTVGPVGTVSNRATSTSRVSSRKKPTDEESDMSLIMTVLQECPLSVTFKDAQGNPAKVESGEWSVTDPSIITIHTDPQDLTKAIVAATGVPGTGQVNVKADARFGPDVKEIFGLLDVEIVSAEATVVEISAGSPVDMNPTPTPQAGTTKAKK